MLPWNNWYHVMGNSYGTWLPGNPKGFRTRHHREHVEGDYRNPPPKGMYDRRLQKARELMNREPVFLSEEQRHRALQEFVKSLTSRDFRLEVMSIDRVHFHLLCPFPDQNPRRWVGLAKRECSHYCKQTGHAPIGGLWEVKTECKPIANEGHFHRTDGYILDHDSVGASIFLRAIQPVLWNFNPDDLLVGP